MPGRLVRPRIYGEQRALFLYPFVQEVGVDFMKGTPGYTMHGTPMKIIIKIKRTLLVHRDRARERDERDERKRKKRDNRDRRASDWLRQIRPQTP